MIIFIIIKNTTIKYAFILNFYMYSYYIEKLFKYLYVLDILACRFVGGRDCLMLFYAFLSSLQIDA